MSGVIVVLFIFLGIYLLVTLSLGLGFLFAKRIAPPYKPNAAVTIIICARNEEKTIETCLHSILQQDFDLSKLQLIIADDGSTDKTAELVEKILSHKALNSIFIRLNPGVGKKRAITKAMEFAMHELIITRDADTFSSSRKWLQSMVSFHTASQNDLTIGPVSVVNERGLLWALQCIENNVLALLTGGSAFYRIPFLCSGANLMFNRSLFEKTNGYASHLNIPSGDDVLFLEDVKKVPGAKIGYVKSFDAIVETYAAKTFHETLLQKNRWASKISYNQNWLNGLLAVLVFIVNTSWIFSLLMYFLDPDRQQQYLLFIGSKLFIDILLLFLASTFIRNRNLIWFTLPVGCIYPFYAFVVSLNSVFMKPKWKT